MIRFVLAVTTLAPLTGACLGPPKDITEEDLAIFDESMASIGCTLRTERDYLPMELQTGLTREKLIELAQYKIAVEQAVALEDGGVRSIVGPCALKEGENIAIKTTG